MSVVYEEYLIKDEGTDSGERCPVCNKSDAIMDVTNLWSTDGGRIPLPSRHGDHDHA